MRAGPFAAAVALAVLSLPAAAQPASGPPVYRPARVVASIPQTGFLTEEETGDLNGDGLADVVVTRLKFQSKETFPVGILINDGHDGFVDATSTMFSGPVPRTQHGRQIVIADFNGDHRADIFIADHGYDADPFPGYPNTLILSTPDGKLVDASKNMPPESGFSHSATAADVNHDGHVDLFVGNLWGGDLTPPEILLNDGTGHFTRATGLLPPAQTDVSQNQYTRSLFLDVDNDGDPDLVLGANDSTASSVVLRNDGTGHFAVVPNAMPPKPFGPNAIAIAFAAADIDKDGYQDLLVGFTKGQPFYVGRWIQVLINNHDGTFRDETATRLPQQNNNANWPHAIRLADLNGDGRTDIGIALSGGGQEKPPFYMDNGSGVFEPLPDGFAGPSATFDFLDSTNDGRPDIFTSTPAFAPSTPEQHMLIEQLAPPERPTGVRASHGTFRRKIRVSWKAVPLTDRYEVWRSRTRHGHRSLIGSTARTRFDDRRVRRGTYFYVVRAINAAGTSGFSSPVRGFRRK